MLTKKEYDELKALTKEERDAIADMLLNCYSQGNSSLKNSDFIDEETKELYTRLQARFGHRIECASQDGDLETVIAANLETIF